MRLSQGEEELVGRRVLQGSWQFVQCPSCSTSFVQGACELQESLLLLPSFPTGNGCGEGGIPLSTCGWLEGIRASWAALWSRSQINGGRKKVGSAFMGLFKMNHSSSEGQNSALIHGA